MATLILKLLSKTKFRRNRISLFLFKINCDGILSNDDIASHYNSLLTQNVISDYQWWAGDLDFDEDNTIFDLLLLVDLLQN